MMGRQGKTDTTRTDQKFRCDMAVEAGVGGWLVGWLSGCLGQKTSGGGRGLGGGGQTPRSNDVHEKIRAAQISGSRYPCENAFFFL